MKLLTGKNILITGGTGTFGHQFVSSMIREHPDFGKIVIYSRDEYKQQLMANNPEFRNNPKLRFFIGDVRDRDRLFRAFDGINIVIHAAALKQIPSCEYNPFEAVKTNINGAQNVIDAAIDRGVEQVVALSTDKACQPINLYGATKLCSDKLFISGNSYVGARPTIFSVVRYGNVAGSRGSVIPYFRELIDSGVKELPLTDERMTRFWLRAEEAVDLVFTALSTMKGGELYVKKIPSIKILDLIKAIDSKATTKIIGIRPGEKIHEMMISSDDAINTLEFPEYYVIKPMIKWQSNQGIKGGKLVSTDFEYHSGNNTDWLSVQEIQKQLSSL